MSELGRLNDVGAACSLEQEGTKARRRDEELSTFRHRIQGTFLGRSCLPMDGDEIASSKLCNMANVLFEVLHENEALGKVLVATGGTLAIGHSRDIGLGLGLGLGLELEDAFYHHSNDAAFKCEAIAEVFGISRCAHAVT